MCWIQYNNECALTWGEIKLASLLPSAVIFLVLASKLTWGMADTVAMAEPATKRASERALERIMMVKSKVKSKVKVKKQSSSLE